MSVDGVPVTLTQTSHYPWEGTIDLRVEPAEPVSFALRLRVPGWARGEPVPSDLYAYSDARNDIVALMVNGEVVDYEVVDGYAVLNRLWESHDSVVLALAMPVRRVTCNIAVSENSGRTALMRGPLLFCVEGIDNGGTVADVALPTDSQVDATPAHDLLGGMVTLTWQDGQHRRTALPYYAWSHRGVGEMAVWLPGLFSPA